MRTIAQLAQQHSRSDEWVRMRLATHQPRPIAHMPRPVAVVMDVTYFGSWGVLVALDPNACPDKGENRVLYHHFLEGSERTVDYEVALDTLEALGYVIQGVTIDGRRGVRQLLDARGIPVQYCHFHQLQTVTRHLTRRPYLPQNRQLRSIALSLTVTTRDQLEADLADWYTLYGTWLKEKDSSTGLFVHPRTRRAYFSICRNIAYLFTYQEPRAVRLPNTTNSLDGRFGVWKDKLQRHRGCSRPLKTKILRSLFAEEQR